MTLTVKSIPFKRLRPVFEAMIKVFRKIISKYRKQSSRGKGIKLIGIRTLESNYNPIRKTYNPHFHIITKGKLTAEIIKMEWLKRAKPGWAAHWCQDMRPVKNNIASLIETVKYASKTFTEPDMVKKSESIFRL